MQFSIIANVFFNIFIIEILEMHIYIFSSALDHGFRRIIIIQNVFMAYQFTCYLFMLGSFCDTSSDIYSGRGPLPVNSRISELVKIQPFSYPHTRLFLDKNNNLNYFPIQTVKGLLLMVKKIFEVHGCVVKKRVETLTQLMRDHTLSKNLEVLNSQYLDLHINFKAIDNLIINSECGTGKTTQLTKIFQQELQLKVISIVPRTTLKNAQRVFFEMFRETHRPEIQCFESVWKIKIP